MEFVPERPVRAAPVLRPGSRPKPVLGGVPASSRIGFDTAFAVKHPKKYVNLPHRLSAVALTVALVAGNAAVCAGWMPTPEARMACCSKSGACPMHKSGESASESSGVLTQAQADTCCASSNPDSSQSSGTFVGTITLAVLGTATVLPSVAPVQVRREGWRTAVPISTAPIPKHVLLSVYLL